jgi:ABC-type antimicrobial peptide transport system permease subunit
MKISRRNFVAAAPFAAGAVLELSGVGFGQMTARGFGGKAGWRYTDSLSRLTWSSFIGYVGTGFAFSDATGRTVKLVLKEMIDLKPPGFVQGSAFEDRFSMTFVGSVKEPLQQDVYSVEHFALGSFNLMITYSGKTGRRAFYEAVINRINY